VVMGLVQLTKSSPQDDRAEENNGDAKRVHLGRRSALESEFDDNDDG
jgi:hypothetical protein